MDINKIKKELSEAAEEKYRDFSWRLIKESALPFLGVRLPALRKMAAEIVKSGDMDEFLEQCDFSSIEMCLLYSYVLGKKKGNIADLLKLFDRAVNYVDNWCTCDILCQSFKQCEKNRAETFEYLMGLVQTGEAFRQRVAVVTMMSHFLCDEYIDRVLSVINETKNENYYYKMGAAWCVATAMAKYRDKTFEFLKNNSLDNWTYNKAIQKITESRRVSEDDKKILKAMRQK